MMSRRMLFGRRITRLLLACIVPTLVNAVDHYCQQNLDTVTGETEGTIITRREGETYYGNNYNCKWLIDAGEGKRIKLTILSMDLEWVPTYTTCSQYDNVKIIEGNSERGDVIAALCSDRNPYHVISHGHSLFLTFKTTHQNFGSIEGVELHFEVFDNNTCPPGWFASDADWCISVNQGTAQWFDAQTYCSYSGANLASITSLEEFQVIYDHGKIVTSKAWIGLHDKATEGTFAWIDRQPYSFQRNFSRSKPNYDEYDCVSQSFTGGVTGVEWLIEKCDTELSFICKAKKDGTTKIYNAVQSSDIPEEGGQEDRINFRIIIVIVVAVVIVGLVIVLCLCRQRHKNNRRKLKAQKQELTTTRDTSQELERLSPHTQDSRAGPSPSAPPSGQVMTFDTQLVAPPTYEESQYHPVAPVDY